MPKKKSATEATENNQTGDNAAATETPTVESAIIAEAQAQIATAKNRIKETKKLGKTIALINGISAWGCEQLEKAIAARKDALTAGN